MQHSVYWFTDKWKFSGPDQHTHFKLFTLSPNMFKNIEPDEFLCENIFTWHFYDISNSVIMTYLFTPKSISDVPRCFFNGSTLFPQIAAYLILSTFKFRKYHNFIQLILVIGKSSKEWNTRPSFFKLSSFILFIYFLPDRSPSPDLDRKSPFQNPLIKVILVK